MKKSSTYKTKPGFVNKADELRQLKQKKLDDNNIKVSKQLDRSADSWKNSMEQIRKIAKKTQDSSQILDNVFTENENDRSEMETEIPMGHSRSVIGDPRYYRTTYQSYGSFQPISQHANYTSNYVNQGFQGRTNDFDTRGFDRYQQCDSVMNMRNPHPYMNINQSNTSNFGQSMLPKFVYQDYRPQNSWQTGLNQSNAALIPPFAAGMSYNQSFPRPYNFYPQPPFQNMVPMNPNYCAPSLPMFNPYLNQYRHYQSPKEDVNGIESMKKYVNSLLDKLELLNKTVANLKNETPLNSSRSRTCSHNHDSCSTSNHGYHDNYKNHPQIHCCPRRKPVPQMPPICSCGEIHQKFINKRSQSSMGEYNPYTTLHNCNHNKNETDVFRGSRPNCNFNCCHTPPRPKTIREPTIFAQRPYYRDYSHPTSPSRFSYTNQSNQEQQNNFKSSSYVRPQTPSSLNDNNNAEVTLIIDNSNNNNKTNSIVDSSDLLSLSEIPDTTM